MTFRTSPAARRGGFTLIELLTVMAVLGILAAILIPTVAGANTSAKRAKTKVMFSQWALAIEGFRQEYGYYPTFLVSKVNAEWGSANLARIVQFQEVLTGKPYDGGSSFASTSESGSSPQNPKRIQFLSFGQGEITENKIQDAFGNTDIVVLVDKNQDGMIRIQTAANNDYSTGDPDFPPNPTLPDNSTLPSPAPAGTIIRATVAFYSAGEGQEVLKSWD
jgi:prepilin-type N-terminal cleavage/methylation domain-containing protein